MRCQGTRGEGLRHLDLTGCQFSRRARARLLERAPPEAVVLCGDDDAAKEGWSDAGALKRKSAQYAVQNILYTYNMKCISQIQASNTRHQALGTRH